MPRFDFQITPQPDETTCGPSCLHAVYRSYGDDIPIEQLTEEIRALPGGGTLAVYLAHHALKRGYDATIYTCDLRIFDPTWFEEGGPDPAERLRARKELKKSDRNRAATSAYAKFLDAGGQVRLRDLTGGLIAEHIGERTPVIAGLCSTWLYRCAREREDDFEPDDICGEPTGHFVVLHGVDLDRDTIEIADPYLHKPVPGSHAYAIQTERLIGALYLGTITYDAKLLVIRPRAEKE